MNFSDYKCLHIHESDDTKINYIIDYIGTNENNKDDTIMNEYLSILYSSINNDKILTDDLKNGKCTISRNDINKKYIEKIKSFLIDEKNI